MTVIRHTRVRSLFNVNNIRLNELLETAQFTIMYGLVGFFCGTYINKIFPKFDKTKSTWHWTDSKANNYEAWDILYPRHLNQIEDCVILFKLKIILLTAHHLLIIIQNS